MEHNKNIMPDSDSLLAKLRRIAATNMAGEVLASYEAEPVNAHAWLYRGLTRGRLHEVYVADQDNVSAGAGFAVALAMAANALPIMWLRTEASERSTGLIHAQGLVELGLDALALLLVVLPDEMNMLPAVADAVRCPGLGSVMFETRGKSNGFDLTVTRRLMLAAESSGVTAFGLHSSPDPVPSAAETRWSVASAVSAAMPADAPGGPAFNVELLRQRGGPSGRKWRVEWNRDAQKFVQSTLSDNRLSLAVDRTSAQHAPSPLRWTG